MALRIYCDFDGTITVDDVTDLLLEAFADPSWHEIEEQWQRGSIGSAACMARQVALMRSTRSALDEAIDQVRIDPHFASFVAFCRGLGVSLVIVSDGLEYAIEHVFARAGIAGLPIIANRLLFLGEERLAMVSPYASPTCSSDAGTCKCAQVDKAAPGDFTVLIGDGRSDFCVAQQVDCVLAKGKLLDFCRTNGIPHVAFSDFREISGFLPILEAMAAPDDAEPPFEAFAGYQISPHGMA